MNKFYSRKDFGPPTRHVGFLVYAGFNLLQLSSSLEAFRLAGAFAAGGYRITIMSLDGGEVEGAEGVHIVTRPVTCDEIDTLVIVNGCHPQISRLLSGLSDFVYAASASVRRIAGIGTGALVLAEAGLLVGKRVAIEAELSTILQRVYPGAKVYSDRSFANDRGLWTAPGPGVELSLALIEQDLGREIACTIARTHPSHPAVKSQYTSPLDQVVDSSAIQHVLNFAREHFDDPLLDEKLAGVVDVSATDLRRDFVAEKGLTPTEAVMRLRAELAKLRVQNGQESFEAISRSVGFRDADEMRRAFLRAFGQPPQGLRRAARSARKAEKRHKITWHTVSDSLIQPRRRLAFPF